MYSTCQLQDCATETINLEVRDMIKQNKATFWHKFIFGSFSFTGSLFHKLRCKRSRRSRRHIIVSLLRPIKQLEGAINVCIYIQAVLLKSPLVLLLMILTVILFSGKSDYIYKIDLTYTKYGHPVVLANNCTI